MILIDGSRAEVVWLSDIHTDGKLTDNHGILYVVGNKLGQRNDKDLSGLTPAQAFESRYTPQSSSLFEDFIASIIIVYDKNGVSSVDDAVRKLIHELYKKGEIAFDALFPGYQLEGYNAESLIGYDSALHSIDLINVIKQYFKVSITFNTHKPVVLRPIQEPVVETVVSKLLEKNLVLLAAYASFGKTITSLQIISKLLPTGGLVLFTTPIVDTLQSLIDNVGKYHFGDDRKTTITFIDESVYNKTPIQDLISRKNNGEIIIIGISVQDLRYQDSISDIDQLREKYADLSGNLDLWVCDERHFHYEGIYTSKKISNLKATYTLDLTATPYEVMDKYEPDQIIARTLSWGMINRDITHLPKLSIEILNTAFSNVFSSSKSLFNSEEGFTPQKLFAMNNKNFLNKAELLKIVELMYHSSLSKKKNLLSIINDTGLSDASKNCGMWLLPIGDSNSPSNEYIPLLSGMLNNSQDHTYFISSYELEKLCPAFESIGDYVEKLLLKHKRVVILTCRKFTTGTDIPSLGHIVMFDKMESIAGFEQLLGRPIRLYNNKDEVKVYSLTPGYSIKATLGKIAKKNEALGGGYSAEFLDVVPLTEYDISNSLSIVDPTDILSIAQEWCEQQVQRGILPALQLSSIVSNFDISDWNSLDLLSFGSVKTLNHQLSFDSDAKTKLNDSPNIVNHHPHDTLANNIKETIQAVILESRWVAYSIKSYDYKTVFKNSALVQFFGEDVLNTIINTAEKNKQFRELLVRDFLNKKMAFEFLRNEEVIHLIFNNSEFKHHEGIVYVDFGLADILVDTVSDINEPEICLVINALNGCVPLSLRKKYPSARIICAEVYDLYKGYLSSIGFDVIDYSDLDNFKKDLVMNRKKFDVIIQNPPYQKNDGGFGASASPIYNKFVEKAIELEPSHIVSVIPSRWMTDGKGLDKFRAKMLNDNRFKVIHDFHDSKHFFPTVDIKGGVCYFRWDYNHTGNCEIFEHYYNKTSSVMVRPLLEDGLDIMIRYNEAIDILHKVQAFNEPTIDSIMPVRDMFGFETKFKGGLSKSDKPITFYGQKVVSSVDRSAILKNHEFIDAHIVIAPEAIGKGNGKDDEVKPIYAGPNSCFSKTYIPLAIFNTEQECYNFMSYVKTKFFHFFLTLKKNTHHTTKKEYSLIPCQDFSKPWTDDELFSKYNFSNDDIEFIKSMVK